MKEGVFINRLDLLIRLQDTTTGLYVGERNLRFYFEGEEIYPTPRGDGNYLLINHGRENGLMQIDVYGFETYRAKLDYEQLDERLPVLDVFLIPSEKTRPGQEMLTLSGRLKGLSSIEAVHLARPFSGLREFDKKRCVMTVYMPNRKMNMVHTYYGLADTASQTYEKFTVLEEVADKKVRIKDPLQGEFPQNAPIFRIIFGETDEEGNYRLRVRKTGGNQKYLIRYVVDGEVRFKVMDFSAEGDLTLPETEEL